MRKLDDDWYSFEAQAEQVVDILVQITDEEGDIDLQLYDPLGGELESSQTTGNNEHIDSFQLPDDGYVLVSRQILSKWNE